MLIGLSGKKGSGKDTVASLISIHSNRVWSRKQFAGKLKEMVSVLLGCSLEDLEKQEYKESSVGWLSTSPRYILQSIGTEWGRDLIDKDIWVKSLLSEYKLGPQYGYPPEPEAYPNWIITDVRFPNEALAVQAHKGILIRVVRTFYNDPHPSETALDNFNDWDYVINNNGSVEQLDKEVAKVCEAFGL